MAHLPYNLEGWLEGGVASNLQDMSGVAKYLAAVVHQIEYAPNYSGGCHACLNQRLAVSLRELMRVEQHQNEYGPMFRCSVAIAVLRDTAQNLCPEHDEVAQQKVQQARYAREKEESNLGKIDLHLESAIKDKIYDWKDL